MIPSLTFTINMPAPLGSAAGLVRLHKKAARDQLRWELENHHRRRFPNRYEASAASRLGYKARDPKYIQNKRARYRGSRDQIKTGRSKRAMESSYKITVGGEATGQTGLSGKLSMRFPFPASFDNSSNKVNLLQMANELSRFTPDEERDVAESYAKGYALRVNDGLANSPRLRKQLGRT